MQRLSSRMTLMEMALVAPREALMASWQEGSRQSLRADSSGSAARRQINHLSLSTVTPRYPPGGGPRT